MTKLSAVWKGQRFLVYSASPEMTTKLRAVPTLRMRGVILSLPYTSS
jgi:hypothetical protein